MKKKNHTLRHWTIWTITWTVVTWVLILLGTVLSGSLNEGGNVVPKAVNWFNEFGTYGEVFGVLKEGMLWDFTHLYADIIWYVGIVVSGLAFFITFCIACTKKKGKYVFASILNLVLCCGILYAYLGLYYSNYLNPTYLQPGLLVRQFTQLLTFSAEGVNFGWSFYAYGMILAIVFTLIGTIGIFVVTLVRLFKKEETAVASETVTPEKTEKVEEAPVAIQPEAKKKGVLILKRYDKYGKTGPVLESQDTSYPHQTIVQKPLTAEEVRNVVRDEFERQEALKLAEQYKQEKNAQLIAEAIVKATNSNKSADEKVKVEEICSSFKEEEEKSIYPSPIIFAMPASAGEEFKQKPKKKPEAPKSEPKAKLNTEKIHEIIAEEISKALSDFVITKETIIQKPVEIKIPVKEEKIEEVTEEPVVEETPVTPVEEKPAETKVEETTTEVIDETVPTETVVEETVVEELPEEKEETPEVEAAPEEVEAEETPAPTEEKAEELPADIPLTSNGTPKIIRIPFTVRMESADQGLRDAYNELKSLLKSYGLNNRVSNSGDTFRLHRVTYCKITIAGKSLKLYLALNPADYVDTTYPIKDASSKAIYKETPLVFKVKSGLSLRRGEELIRDCMDKHGLEQVKQLETRDWATDLSSVEFENDDFDDGDDEE